MNKRIRIAFTVAGDPEAMPEEQLAKLEIDVLEIGVAFSDPVAESPAVQAANLRALSGGAKNGAVEAAINLAKNLRSGSAKIVLYSYYNPVFRFGVRRFFKECAVAGIEGVTITDMPFEERGEAQDSAREHGISLLSTIATTDIARAKLIAKEAEGYLRIEPVGSRAECDAVIAAAAEVSSVPYALCLISPEA